MDKTCLIVRGKKHNDDIFRPSTPVPEKHWAYLLLDSYAEYNEEKRTVSYPRGIDIHWDTNRDDIINVKVKSELWKNNENCFEHLMSFIKQNDLTYEFPCNMDMCIECEGHPSCISNQHTAAETFDSVPSSENFTNAA